MRVAFPYPARVRQATPRLEGLRHQPFTNIDGETFGTPTLNGFWRIDLQFVARDMKAQLAVSSWMTAMSAAATECLIPICTHFRPNNATGRMLSHCDMAPEYTLDHIGFEGEPFGGFTLRNAASHRDSYVNVNKPALSDLWPGMFLTLGERLHQVISVSAINESETAVRLHLMPNLRGDYPSGELVIVDRPHVLCRMESGDPISFSPERIKLPSVTLIEAF